MRPLSPGQDTVLSWPAGAIDCRVVAAAGSFVLLKAERISNMAQELPTGTCSLTFLDGMIPMGWDGVVEFSSAPGELRFRTHGAADRRSSVRLPIFADVSVSLEDRHLDCQLLDISAGGMRFRTPVGIEKGSAVRVRAVLPGGGPTVEADAVVRASERSVAAVEFTLLHGGLTAQDIGAWTVGQLRNSLQGRG